MMLQIFSLKNKQQSNRMISFHGLFSLFFVIVFVFLHNGLSKDKKLSLYKPLRRKTKIMSKNSEKSPWKLIVLLLCCKFKAKYHMMWKSHEVVCLSTMSKTLKFWPYVLLALVALVVHLFHMNNHKF